MDAFDNNGFSDLFVAAAFVAVLGRGDAHEMCAREIFLQVERSWRDQPGLLKSEDWKRLTGLSEEMRNYIRESTTSEAIASSFYCPHSEPPSIHDQVSYLHHFWSQRLLWLALSA